MDYAESANLLFSITWTESTHHRSCWRTLTDCEILVSVFSCVLKHNLCSGKPGKWECSPQMSLFLWVRNLARPLIQFLFDIAVQLVDRNILFACTSAISTRYRRGLCPNRNLFYAFASAKIARGTYQYACIAVYRHQLPLFAQLSEKRSGWKFFHHCLKGWQAERFL